MSTQLSRYISCFHLQQFNSIYNKQAERLNLFLCTISPFNEISSDAFINIYQTKSSDRCLDSILAKIQDSNCHLSGDPLCQSFEDLVCMVTSSHFFYFFYPIIWNTASLLLPLLAFMRLFETMLSMFPQVYGIWTTLSHLFPLPFSGNWLCGQVLVFLKARPCSTSCVFIYGRHLRNLWCDVGYQAGANLLWLKCVNLTVLFPYFSCLCEI